MSTSPAPVPIETLLTHRDWVRRLARSLVRDQSSADDVEQQTWLAALRRPPHDEETSRAWLGRVVRNFASDRRRALRRRDAHERTASRPEAARSTTEVVAESEAHMQVVLAVHRLAEPYRTTVLLRWFEDLPPRAIADRMEVPVETVRTRLRRAHESLRRDLGRAPGGEAGWVAVLVPLTGLRPETLGVWSGTAAQTVSLGGVVMGTKAGVALAVGVAVAAAFVGGTIVGDYGDSAARTGTDPEVAELRARLDAIEATRGRPGDRQATAGAERRIDGLEAHAATQDSRLDALEASLGTVSRDVAAVAAGAGPRAAGVAPPAADAAAALQRLPELSDDDVFQAIRDMMGAGTRGGKTDGKAVVDACDVLLARTLVPARRAEALTYKGIGHRILRERSSEEAAFRAAVAAAGPGSKEALEAAQQLAWTAAGSDHRGAAELFLGVARDPGATLPQRAANRYYAAGQFEAADDRARAVTEYRSVVDEFGNADDSSARKIAEDARVALERLARASSPDR